MVRQVLFIASLLCITSQAEARNINLTTLNWPPYYSSDLKNGGVVAALAKAAASTQGHTIELTWQPWKRALELTKNGDYDGLLGAYYNTKRDQSFHYTYPIYHVTGYFIARNDFGMDSYDTLRDLEGFRIGVIRGGEYPDHFDTAQFLSKSKGTKTSIVRHLNNGIYDLVAMVDTVFYNIIKRQKYQDPRDYEQREFYNIIKRLKYQDPRDYEQRDPVRPEDYKTLHPPLWHKNLYIAISKHVDDAKRIRGAINEGIQTIIQNGRYTDIVESYGFKAKINIQDLTLPGND